MCLEKCGVSGQLAVWKVVTSHPRCLPQLFFLRPIARVDILSKLHFAFSSETGHLESFIKPIETSMRLEKMPGELCFRQSALISDRPLLCPGAVKA